MATKTISVDLEAYTLLSRARRSKRESFSQVIKRAKWEQKRKTCGDLLAALPQMPAASSAAIKRLERAQKDDSPPDSHWS
jgi:predicted CopG family antitoxin